MGLSATAPKRRAVLLGVGAVGAAAFLAACGSSSSDNSAAGNRADLAGNQGGSTPGATTPGATTPAATTPAAKTPATAGGTAVNSANALGAETDIPVGGGKIFSDKLIVVTQPTKGDFKAFTAICTHLQCTVGTIENGQIICPCHGSRYSIADGSVIQGPAPRALAPKSIKVAKGEVTLG